MLAAVLFLCVSVQAISADKAILTDAATGRVIYAKNAQERSLIASTTKIMTALVVCSQCNVLDRVRIPAEAVGVEGSSMYLRAGEVLTVQELLYGLMLQSGNDAAVALAIYCGGTVEGFAQLMNDKARAIGMENTHFVNPHGLDAPEHYSTAADLAKLAAYAMEDPIFARTVGTKTVRVGERYLTNHNKLLWQVEGAEGIKTGFTKAAGRILVSSASRQGRRLICVTIHAPDDWADHASLYEKGFQNYTVQTPVKKGQLLGMRSVAGGEAAQVHLLAGEDFSYSLAKEERLELCLPPEEFVYAPVAAGSRAGTAFVMLQGQCVGEVELIYGETVEQIPEQERSFLQRLFGG